MTGERARREQKYAGIAKPPTSRCVRARRCLALVPGVHERGVPLGPRDVLQRRLIALVKKDIHRVAQGTRLLVLWHAKPQPFFDADHGVELLQEAM